METGELMAYWSEKVHDCIVNVTEAQIVVDDIPLNNGYPMDHYRAEEALGILVNAIEQLEDAMRIYRLIREWWTA